MRGTIELRGNVSSCGRECISAACKLTVTIRCGHMHGRYITTSNRRAGVGKRVWVDGEGSLIVARTSTNSSGSAITEPPFLPFFASEPALTVASACVVTCASAMLAGRDAGAGARNPGMGDGWVLLAVVMGAVVDQVAIVETGCGVLSGSRQIVIRVSSDRQVRQPKGKRGAETVQHMRPGRDAGEKTRLKWRGTASRFVMELRTWSSSLSGASLRVVCHYHGDADLES